VIDEPTAERSVTCATDLSKTKPSEIDPEITAQLKKQLGQLQRALALALAFAFAFGSACAFISLDLSLSNESVAPNEAP
jgi:hypothetical protein